MAPTEGQQKESESLKLKGNEAFKKKEFSAAHTFYTSAIALTPASAALYSNRAATLLSMNQPNLALADANRAIQLDPAWPKAHRRKGSVLEVMADFAGAKQAYEKSLEVSLELAGEDVEGRRKAEEEVKPLLESLDKRRVNTSAGKVMTIADSPGPRVMAEFERRCAAGEPMGSWPPNGSCLRRIWVAEMQFQNALQNLSQFTEGQIPGAPPGVVGIYGRVQTLEELTTALLEDIRVVRITQDTLDKLALCYKLEQQQRNAIGPGMSPKETIAEYNRRLTQPASVANGPAARMGLNFGPARGGWDIVRPALQLSIRSAIMNGCLYSLDLAPGKDESEFRRAVDLIEEARRTWRYIDGSIRGRTLEETFLRGVKALLADSIVRSYPSEPASANAGAAAASRRRKLDEIRSIGEWLTQSFANSPKPPDAEKKTRPRDDADPWWNIYYAHYVSPLARGTTFVAFAHTQLALDFLSGPARTASLLAGAKEYATAAGWMSPDDPERVNRALNAIFALASAGAPLYKSDVAAVLAMAEKATEWYAPYFTQVAHLDSHVGWAAGLEAAGRPDQPPVTAETLSLTAAMRQAWQARIANGETEEAVGGKRIWTALGPDTLAALEKDGLGWSP